MSIKRSLGVTLVELIVFMVLVGVAMAGVFAAFNTMTAGSADPEVRKQMVAIAESLMEEIQLRPFACSAGCSGSRPYDSVSAYNGLTMTGITDMTDPTPIPGLTTYSAFITVTPAVLGSGANTIPSTASLLISIRVTHVSGSELILEGYRTHYAPETDPQ
ncbi:MAG TPA: hypothetical protein VHN19_07810 [Burkholderiales bacterium]|jgi:MSHA pilin protein MshD|nr:hypothetical protein [Burkholderiales bacterium]